MIDTTAFEEAVYQYKLDCVTLELCRSVMMNDTSNRSARKNFESALQDVSRSAVRMNKLESAIVEAALASACLRLNIPTPE
ncbi:hypothetical protein D3C87_838940 [compost metagenome]